MISSARAYLYRPIRVTYPVGLRFHNLAKLPALPAPLFLYDRAMAGKAVIVHSLEHARAALAAAAELGVPVTLASAPGASAYAGPGWFQEMTALAAAEVPRAAFDAVIDCADRPGDVLLALRLGLRRVRFTGKTAVARKLAAIAEQSGAELVTGRLRALDLRGAADPAGACRAWLAPK
jgi:hypothetical protein